MRALAILLAVLALAISAWFLTRGDDESTIAAAYQSPTTDELPERNQIALTETQTEVLETAESNSSRVPDSIELESPSMVTITGTVVFLDQSDARFESESGTLLTSKSGFYDDTKEIPIVAGRFEFEVERDSSFDVRGVELPGLDCGLVDYLGLLEAHEDFELEVLVRRRLPSSLIVRSLETGEQLSGLTVCASGSGSFSSATEPAKEPYGWTLGTALHSPIRLPSLVRPCSWWVRADGYSWERVDFDHRYGGERIVSLRREASMRVQLHDLLPGQSVSIKLTEEEDSFGDFRAREAAPDASGLARFDGLRPGRWRVTCEHSDPASEEEELARTTADLSSGRESLVELWIPPRVPKPEPRKRVRVSGSVIFPSATSDAPSLSTWLSSPEVTVSLWWTWLGAEPKEDRVTVGYDVSALSETERSCEWATQELAPGNWRVEVEPFGHTEEITIGPEGAAGIELRLPALREVLVELRDAKTGAPLSGGSVDWWHRPGRVLLSNGDGVPTGVVGTHRIFCAPSELQLQARGEGYADTFEDVSIGALGGHFVLELEESVSVFVTLRDGTAAVPCNDEWWFALDAERRGERGYIRMFRSTNTTATMRATFSAPGTYLLRFSEIRGYKPIEPLEVTLVRGEQELEVQLVRKH